MAATFVATATTLHLCTAHKSTTVRRERNSVSYTILFVRIKLFYHSNEVKRCPARRVECAPKIAFFGARRIPPNGKAYLNLGLRNTMHVTAIEAVTLHTERLTNKTGKKK